MWTSTADDYWQSGQLIELGSGTPRTLKASMKGSSSLFLPRPFFLNVGEDFPLVRAEMKSSHSIVEGFGFAE